MEGLQQYRRVQKAVQQTAKSSKGGQFAARDNADSENPEDETAGKHHVEFGTNDHLNPRNWSSNYKLFCVTIIWLLAFITGWASAADSTAVSQASKQYHVSPTADSLTTAMFLFGVAICAVLTGPLSETFGRLPTYLVSFAIYLVWLMATALASNYGAQITFRLLTGVFASGSMTIYGGSLADMYEKEDRAKIWPFFALSPLLGPTIAPIASGWIAQELGWPWVDWITLIISGAFFILAALFLPETYSPTILSWKATFLRNETGSDAFKTENDEHGSSFERMRKHLYRIGYFLFVEKTTVFFEAYLTLLYVLIYGFLEGFHYIFSETYGLDVGQTYSAFGAIALGILTGLPYVLVVYHLSAKHKLHEMSSETPPEQRLIPALYAALLLPISLFWIGWTNRLEISDWSNLAACYVLGFALMSLFTSTYHYLLDAYGTNAASALAAVTFMRYAVSGGVVIAIDPLYKALTVRWMLTLLGCLATVLTPVPWLFYKFGPKIRRTSKYAE